MLDNKKLRVITSLVERELTQQEKNSLVQDMSNIVSSIDTSIVEAYYDTINKSTNTIDLKINCVEGRYYFHVPTGWILTFTKSPLLTDAIRRGICKKIYFRSFASIVFDKLTKNKTEIDNEKLGSSKGLKKLGYRMLFCLSKKNEKSILLVIARHISVLSNMSIVASQYTRSALTKARYISHSRNIVYPNIYYLDKMLKNTMIKNEILFYKRLKRILNIYSKVLFIP